MPVKEIENIIIEFIYNDSNYVLDKYRIYDDHGNFVCTCDFTGTKYYGDRALMEFAAKICLRTFYHGKFVGEEEGRKEVQDNIKNALGL